MRSTTIIIYSVIGD